MNIQNDSLNSIRPPSGSLNLHTELGSEATSSTFRSDIEQLATLDLHYLSEDDSIEENSDEVLFSVVSEDPKSSSSTHTIKPETSDLVVYNRDIEENSTSFIDELSSTSDLQEHEPMLSEKPTQLSNFEGKGLDEEEEIIPITNRSNRATNQPFQFMSDSVFQNRKFLIQLCLSSIAALLGGGLWVESRDDAENYWIRSLSSLVFCLGAIGILSIAFNLNRNSQNIESSGSLINTDAQIKETPKELEYEQINFPLRETIKLLNENLSKFDKIINNKNNKSILMTRVNAVKDKGLKIEIETQIISNILENFDSNMKTIQRRITNDEAQISKVFFKGRPFKLVKIKMASGETHHKGRIPCFLTFEIQKSDGSIKKKKILYKPRDIRPDQLICSSLPIEPSSMNSSSTSSPSMNPSSSTSSTPQSVSNSGRSLFTIIADFLEIKMPTYRFLPMKDQERNGASTISPESSLIDDEESYGPSDDDDVVNGTESDAHYGYVEYLSHQNEDYRLETDVQITEYYQMIGRLQALSQIFGIYDLHNGNVFAHRRLPCLTDLETSFDPIRTRDDTSLNLAVTQFADGEDTPTQNRVIIVDSHGQEHPDPLSSSSPFRVAILKSIQDGFEEICHACREDEDLRQQLFQFLDQLPLDLLIRFVPVGTPTLSRWLSDLSPEIEPSSNYTSLLERPPRGMVLNLYDAAYHLLYYTFLFQNERPHDAELRGVLPDSTQGKISKLIEPEVQQLSRDFSSHDIPAMILNLNSLDVSHNQLDLNRVYDRSPIEIIRERIISPPAMFEEFRKLFN